MANFEEALLDEADTVDDENDDLGDLEDGDNLGDEGQQDLEADLGLEE